MKHAIKTVLLVSALIAVTACNKNKESADVAALAKQLNEMQAKLEAAESANAGAEEIERMKKELEEQKERAEQRRERREGTERGNRPRSSATAQTAAPATTPAAPAPAATATTAAPAKSTTAATTPVTTTPTAATPAASTSSTGTGGFQMSGTTLTKYTGTSKDVIIPNNVTSIGERAFDGAWEITSVTIPNSVTSIGNLAFTYSSLKSVTIGSGVTSINRQDFPGYFASITVDANNPNFSSVGGILYNKAKTEILLVPRGITGNVTIPNGVTRIGYQAFDGTGITSVTIPNSVTSIESVAFGGCGSLTSITLGSNITSIESGAFSRTYITSVTFQGTNPELIKDQFVGDLQEKYLAGGSGTYARTETEYGSRPPKGPPPAAFVWTKQ